MNAITGSLLFILMFLASCAIVLALLMRQQAKLEKQVRNDFINWLENQGFEFIAEKLRKL